MKTILTSVIAAMFLLSAPAFADDKAGGDKKAEKGKKEEKGKKDEKAPAGGGW